MLLINIVSILGLVIGATDSKPRTLPIVDTDDRITASAILLSPSMALTSAHAVGDLHTVSFVRCGNELLAAQVIKHGYNHDLALLLLSNRCFAVSPLILDIDDPDKGSEVEAYGYPNREFTHLVGKTDGYQLFWKEAAGIFWMGLVIETKPAVDHGNSGGPLIDSKTGKLVGIVQGYFERDGKRIGVVVPASTIRLFLNTPAS